MVVDEERRKWMEREVLERVVEEADETEKKVVERVVE